MTRIDLTQLDLKRAGSWPTPLKLAAFTVIFVALLGVGYWFDWSDQLDALSAAKQEETRLKTTFLEKKKLAVNLTAYRTQLAEIERSLSTLLKQLPNKSEMDALLTDINQAGLGRGLQFELFKPASQENVADFYAELPVSVRVSGNYHDLGAFVSDVAKLPRIVVLTDLSVASNKDQQLTMDATAKTYRYLDEEELARQKKAAKAAKAGK